MGYITETLASDEEIKDIYSLHWAAKIPMIFGFILFLPIVGYGIYEPLAIPLVPIPLLFSFYEKYRLKNLEQGSTTKRVIKKSGIVSRKTEEMRMSSIETVEIHQSIMGRIFGFGDVKVTGRGLSDVVFAQIDDPMEVKRSIERV